MEHQQEDIKISIIMPIYNSGKLLQLAVDSILSQKFRDFELIMVDDGSTDGSSMLCDKYAQNDKRIKVIHKQNGGICNARNIALAMARGKYIAFADHDDEYLPDVLGVIYNLAEVSGADIVKYGMHEESWTGNVMTKERFSNFTDHLYEADNISREFVEMLQDGVFNFVWDGLYRRDFIIRSGVVFDENFRCGGEDISYMLDLACCRPKIQTVGRIFYKHYVRKGFSTSSKVVKNKDEETFAVHTRLAHTIEVLDCNIESIKDDYIFYLIGSFINQMTTRIANPVYGFSVHEAIIRLQQMKQQTFLPEYFCAGSVKEVWKKSKKLSLAYFFFKHDLWLLLYWLYALRLYSQKWSLRLKCCK